PSAVTPAGAKGACCPASHVFSNVDDAGGAPSNEDKTATRRSAPGASSGTVGNAATPTRWALVNAARVSIRRGSTLPSLRRAAARRSGRRRTRAWTPSATIAIATAITGLTSRAAAAVDGPVTNPTTTSGAAATSTGRSELSARPASTSRTTTTATPANVIAAG